MPTPGTLYNYGNNELWVSFDYGVSWGNVENFSSSPHYTSGCIEGEIYKCCANVQGTVWRSINFGNSFEEIREDIKYNLEVGINHGIVYGLSSYPYPEVGFRLKYSNDYALNFIEIPIDSSVAFWVPSGHYPKISRGTEPGELYLVSWWPDYHYKIFHSADTGYTWTEKFESEYINILSWSLSYTAGRQQGSFYVSRITYDYATQYSFVYIDYSSDYGKTFTTFFHGAPSPQPSNYPENFSAHNIELQWTDPDEGVLPHAYLVLMSEISFEAIKTPIDNVAVPDSYTVKNISYGVEKCIFTNLTPGTLYYFRIFPYTSNGDLINYKTEGGGIQAMKMTKE